LLSGKIAVMPETQLNPRDVRLMQGLAQQVTALRPELQNNDATVGELAWIWGKDHADQGGTWRHRLWFCGGDLVGWGWIFLPYQVMRSDGQVLDMTMAALTWQVHPGRCPGPCACCGGLRTGSPRPRRAAPRPARRSRPAAG
jgi:hypothetical protein